jgi:hypothetical protein
MAGSFFDNRKLRNLHRDLGYFYVGLIIAFGISGIAQNHRKQWKPERYVYEFKKVQTVFHLPKESVTRDGVEAFSKENGLTDMRQFDFRKDSTLVISYKDADATIQLATGKGEVNIWRKRPVLAQLISLHKNNGNMGWIWYSDIFSLSLITIASTGMFLMKGKNSFRSRGWKFALAGILFPILALLLFL